jgi:hypothetical protein
MKLCKRGLHEFAGERCRECSCEQKRADYGANREKYRAIARAYALANRERAREKSRLWRAANPLKNRENCKAWAVANPEKVRERDRIRKYGLKPGEWDAMFLAQGSKCAICFRTTYVGKNWHTDHCHLTGKVRGIICHHCNHMLGGAQDVIANLLSAARYLSHAPI